MDRAALRKLAVALVATVLVAESGVLVWQWRSAASSRAQARRAEQAAEAQRRLDESQGQPGQGGQGGADTGDLLGQLGSLLGNGGGGLDALGGLLGGGGDATACIDALAGAGQGGGLFGGGGQAPSGDLRAQVRSIATSVQHLRGLRFKHLPAPRFLSPAALASRVAASVAKDYPRAQADAEGRALVAIGALPAGSDLKALQAKALSGAVAGFYDPDTGELVVGSGAKLSASSRVTLSHELEHALADQNLHLPAAAEHPRPGQADANLGALGLVEGDATLTMQQYSLAKLGLEDQLSMLSEALPAQGKLDRLPAYLSQRLTFPYLQGMSFVCKLYASGGWKRVDRAYARPPTTSAQVLFPDRYEANEQALDPRDAPAPAASWRLLGRDTFGAADLLWQFQAPGGHKDRALDRTLDRAAAWAGGELATYADGSRTGVSLALAQRRGSSGLCQSVQAWYQAAFPASRAQAAVAGETMARQGPTDYAVLRCPGGEARLGIAPDAATARTLAS
ncbi:MAG TPA: hypothetical protein VF486_05820 [Actinomycetes bacterium]